VDITVGLCTYNRAEMLSRTLESLTAQDTGGRFTFEILVVDDGSTDNTADAVRDFANRFEFPIRYLRNSQPGIGSARTKVIEESTSPWIAFIDDDELATTGWLSELYDVVDQDGPFIVGGAIHLLLPDETIARLSPVCRMLLGEGRYPFDQPRKLAGGASPGTGNVLLAREVFERVGVFDTTGSAGEDSDLWRRAQNAGYEMWHAPAAVVHHVIPPERLTDSYFKWNSMRWGNNFARQDWIRRGRGATLFRGVARIAKVIVIDLPGVFVSLLARDEKSGLDRKCAMWRSLGYARRCASLLAPRLLAQDRFNRYLDFRAERNLKHH
jgi:glycosyltransferase involved in cell wall biosynthesis